MQKTRNYIAGAKAIKISNVKSDFKSVGIFGYSDAAGAFVGTLAGMTVGIGLNWLGNKSYDFFTGRK